MSKDLVTFFLLNETIQDVLASQKEVFLWMYRVVLGLSLLLSVLVLLTYFFFKNEFPYSIPMFFNMAVFMLTLSLCISAISPEWVVSNKVPCYIQAIGIQFSGTSVICWYTIISLSLLVIVEKKSMKMLMSYQIWIHLYCWGLPFILTIIPVALQESTEHTCDEVNGIRHHGQRQDSQIIRIHNNPIETNTKPSDDNQQQTQNTCNKKCNKPQLQQFFFIIAPNIIKGDQLLKMKRSWNGKDNNKDNTCQEIANLNEVFEGSSRASLSITRASRSRV